MPVRTVLRPLKVVQDQVGPGSTDFCGISFAPSDLKREPMDDAELDRKIKLLRPSWGFFDAISSRVSTEMARRPSGGERDRDKDHTTL
jgi:hypothetical protein